MEQELRMLLKRPGNDVCADCGGRYPRFASISLAIFLCNRCYGIHRSIGTHVTRTKTVGLDQWNLDEVHRMSSIGNIVANSYWEGCTIPPLCNLKCELKNTITRCVENAPISHRPNADSPDFEVEKWIRDKYERKLFCSLSREPPSVTPKMTELIHPIASTRSINRKVKLLPRGTLQCGPDCASPRSSGESSRVRLRRSSQPCTISPTKTSQIPFSSQSSIDHAHGNAVSEKQSELVFDDDEDFGEFVQA